MSALDNVVFDEPGVVANQDDPANDGFGFDYAVEGEEAWTFFGPGNTTHSMPVDQVIEHPETASMEIVSNGTTYTVRPVRYEDGVWLSKYQIGLPEEALFGLVLASPGSENMINEDERLVVRYAEDVSHVLEVLYLNALGVWSRQHGTFIRVSDSLAGLDDYSSLDIDPTQAQDFLDLYDRKYVTVEEAREYALDEAPVEESDEPESDTATEE